MKKLNESFKRFSEYKPSYRQLLKENDSNEIDYRHESVGYHHGQSDFIWKAYDGDKVIGFITYVVYEGNPSIQMVEVLPEYRRKGIASTMYKKIADEYGYKNFDWSNVTDNGAKLRAYMDKYYNYDRKKEMNKSLHYPKSIIKKIGNKHPFVAKFLTYIANVGYSEAWDKYFDEMKEHESPNGVYIGTNIDFNDISELGRWIEGSVENKNDIKEEPPYWVKDTVKELL